METKGETLHRGDIVAVEPDQTPAMAGAHVNRAAAARILGVSVTTLRRMEGAELHPRSGPRGEHLFDVAEIEAVAVRYRRVRRGAVANDGIDGPLAADVFTLLDDGVHPVDVVKRLQVHPAVVESLQTTWVRMRGALVLSASARGEIADFLADGDELHDEREMVERLRRWCDAEAGSCGACGKSEARFCTTCARNYGERAKVRAE